MANRGWIGVDLDGTLAEYHGWEGVTHIGKPIPAMLERVNAWLAAGEDVRIVTARVSHDGTDKRLEEARAASHAIDSWLRKWLGHSLPITCCKDYGMITLYDDRCVQVEVNTGRLIGEHDHRT